MLTILWTRANFVGLLLAESELELLPAEPWPLEAAIEKLAAGPGGGELAVAAKGWLAPRPTARGRVDGVRLWVRDAAEAGLLAPEGQGWAAGYRPSIRWLAASAAIRDRLAEPELAALREGAQCLVAMASMLSKNAAA